MNEETKFWTKFWLKIVFRVVVIIMIFGFGYDFYAPPLKVWQEKKVG